MNKQTSEYRGGKNNLALAEDQEVRKGRKKCVKTLLNHSLSFSSQFSIRL